MNMSEKHDEYDMIHKLTMNNKVHIHYAGGATCVFCGVYTDHSEITDYVMDSGGPTACCPHCGVDCMVPIIWNCSGVEMLSKDFFDGMRDYFFGPANDCQYLNWLDAGGNW